tara:strand:+ start:149 stop:829 length:681 start_codon:yes stop_codon:yes gene_type:complete
MENEAIVNTFFGLNVYRKKIENEDEKIASYVESFVKEKNGVTVAVTDNEGYTVNTDLKDDNLHDNEKYSSLFAKIKICILDFINTRGYNLDKFDIHMTKTWATYTEKNQKIGAHKHTASHYSFVYYLRNIEGMGNIKFEKDASQNALLIPPTEEYFSSWNHSNFSSYTVPVSTGDFIIFPSELSHHTEINTTDQARISISGDILLTMKPGVKALPCIPHPSGWLTI